MREARRVSRIANHQCIASLGSAAAFPQQGSPESGRLLARLVQRVAQFGHTGTTNLLECGFLLRGPGIHRPRATL